MASREVMEQWGQTSEEDKKKEMDKWRVWGEAHQGEIVEFGNPVGTNMRVTIEGGTETPNEVAGYSIIQAESKEDAVKVVADNPHLVGGATYTDVMEIIDLQ